MVDGFRRVGENGGMDRKTRIGGAALIVAALMVVSSAFLGAEGFRKASDFEGRWIGTFTNEAGELGFELLVIKGGALFSVPAQKVHGMPVAGVRFEGGTLTVTISAAEPAVALAGRAEGSKVVGELLRGKERNSVFSMERAPGPARKGDDVQVKGPKGTLPGTLLLPDAASFPGPRPLVVMIADSGPTDRDGNNHTVPGRNDCLLQLAEALAVKGVATLRYDKRGAGESYYLAPEGGKLLFGDYVADAVAAIRQFSKDKRFSAVAVLGHGEGSTVGMAAAREGGADGFISVAGPGLPAWKMILGQLSAIPPEAGEDRAAREREWNRIVESLKAGKRVSDVPEDLMGLFRPEVQPFLISWFAADPKELIGKITAPVQIIQGGNDLRVGPDDAEALGKGAGSARESFIPAMNHVLKDVLPVEDMNWAAYSDPEYPLAGGIVTAVIQFIEEKVLPAAKRGS